ncbi:hypothetical protein MXD62_19375 [Frankia sp. Mgl5]|uniref:hypothetical protein n=1 Tax=Frankia sp. Mgl5 TaxID=2933793 RepID=UPI0020107DF3|nr:hypothetical protein [Frankia sp. Mgl5]MCK9929313.1 hypothetical protein [Frankia sp. Mgl5]
MLTRPKRLALLSVLVLLVGLAAWYVRDTQQALGANQRALVGTERALVELGREVRADCAFKRDIAAVADEVTTAGPVTLTLSWDAYDAYVIKGCVGELGAIPEPSRPRPPADRP